MIHELHVSMSQYKGLNSSKAFSIRHTVMRLVLVSLVPIFLTLSTLLIFCTVYVNGQERVLKTFSKCARMCQNTPTLHSMYRVSQKRPMHVISAVSTLKLIKNKLTVTLSLENSGYCNTKIQIIQSPSKRGKIYCSHLKLFISFGIPTTKHYHRNTYCYNHIYIYCNHY